MNQALAFADANFPIIPIRVYQDGARWKKMPLASWDLATASEITIRSWWSDWPDALPAIPLRKTNLCVVDADRREALPTYPRCLGPHSKIATPSGGLHLVFAQPDPPITKLDWCDGVEILGTSCLLTCYDLEELKFPHVAPRAILPEVFRKPRDRKADEGNLIIKRRGETLVPPTEAIHAADLTSALWQMDAADWNSAFDEWFTLMAACAYAGIGCEDFVAWSITDPDYACDARLIRRMWRGLRPKHGGALMAALKARGIKVRSVAASLINEVPPIKPEPTSTPNRRRADARINAAVNAIDADPTEPCLFWAACLCAEVVHEVKYKRSAIMNFIIGSAGPVLREKLGKDGIRRTVENAFRRVEQKLLATPNGQKGNADA
jgi:hypothetical protein